MVVRSRVLCVGNYFDEGKLSESVKSCLTEKVKCRENKIMCII